MNLSAESNAGTRERIVGIIGGGPAGLSAALWLRNLGCASWLVESSDRLGGMQNLDFLGNDWVLGQRDMTGPELAARFTEHVEAGAAQVLLDTRVTRITHDDDMFRVTLNPERQVAAHALLIATGTRYRSTEVMSDVQGATTMTANELVYGPWAFTDLAALAGRRVLVIGGGDNAFENTRLLSETAASVDLVMRAASRAQAALQNEVAARSNCHVHAHARVLALMRTPAGIDVALSNGQRLIVDRVHVLAGYAPNTDVLTEMFGVLASNFAFDASGYLRTDDAGRTGVAGVYAAGDVCNPEFPSVVAALAQGARAAKAIEHDLRQPLHSAAAR